METQDKKETQLRSLAEIIATAGRNCEFLLELNKVSIYKITCNSNEAINENYKNFKWSLLTDPVSPFQIIWFSAFRHRWATITALWTDPPPHICLVRGHMCKNEAALYTQMPQLMWSTSH